MENFAASILCIVSSMVWTWAMIRRMRSKPIIPPTGVPEQVPIIALALGGLWVAMSLTSQLALLVRSEPIPTTLQLDAIKTSVYISGTVTLVLAVVYSLGSSTKQENQLPALRAISLGFLAFFASMLPVLGVLELISKWSADKTSHELLTFLQNHKSPTEMMWVGASAVVVAPLLEELVYRVILQRAISQRFGSTAAILTTAVIFSLVHGWPNMIGLLPLALILGYLFEQTNNYLAVVATHASFNLCMLILTAMSMGA